MTKKKTIEERIEEILNLEGFPPVGELRGDWQKRQLKSLLSDIFREIVGEDKGKSESVIGLRAAFKIGVEWERDRIRRRARELGLEV